MRMCMHILCLRSGNFCKTIQCSVETDDLEGILRVYSHASGIVTTLVWGTSILLIRSKHKVWLTLMGMSLLLQVFDHEQTY